VKVGDLVKMKRTMFWMLKGNQHQHYTEEPLIVLETVHNAVNVIYPDGRVKRDLIDHYEVISESR
jgi:hypothetical protein